MTRRRAARDWRRRIAGLRREVSAGDVDAMAELGQWLQHGAQDRHGHAIIRRNPRAGFRLLLRAAASRQAEVAFPLAWAYDAGLGTRRDKREALRWYRRAWRAGRSTAALNIAILHRDDRELHLAFRWWKRAAEHGDGDGAVDAGYCYQYGIGTRRSVRLAHRMYRRALASSATSAYGREEACYHLAVLHLDERRTRLALPLLLRAAADGDYPEAGSLLARVRSRMPLVPCRCRRGLLKRLPGRAACPRHPRVRGRVGREGRRCESG
jgi:hypothetical protein